MTGGFWRRRAERRAFRRGNAARDRRRWREAALHYRRYLEQRPEDFAIWVQLGHMLAESGDHAGADRAYRTAHDLRSDDADLALCRGHLARRAGDLDQALLLYRRSFELDGNAHAERALLELQPPEPEPEPEPEAEAEPEVPSEPEPAIKGGVIEGWYERSVSGVLHRAGDVRPTVEFRAGERLVGRARAYPREEDGALFFRALLDIDLGENGEGVEIEAFRMPDGAPLDPGPITLFPPSRHPADHPIAWSVPAEIVKPLDTAVIGEIALFVTHSRSGKIKPHILPYIRALKDAGLAVFLIATVDRPVDLPAELVDLADAVMVRRNAGYDFGAWAHALRFHSKLYGAATLYLLNDSVLPARDGGRIAALVDRVRASSADLIGLTESHEWRWHVQSYFLAVKPRLLTSRAFHAFMNDIRLLTRKDHVIRAYEVRLAEMTEQAGCAVELLYPSATAINPTLFGWRALLAAGMPFVKLLLLRGEFEDIDVEGWQEALSDAGFDVDLAEAVIAAAAEQGPIDDGGRLLARRMPMVRRDDAPLRISFFGPWNYDNGLGAASRGIIAAIRRTGPLLSLHPIKHPFHVHKPLAPPVDIVDFEGPADIAVVHLNPDSWHLLTDDQRAAIGAAGKRIGYWVWEMGQIPPAWRRHFHSVDRIWAPSRYCAEVFAAEAEVPVDVVPHVVPVPEPAAIDRAALLERFGLPAGCRMILYVFDGSSYLVRKNPAALVRAFSASGLAQRGWSLILKTKHLHDRPEEGEAFRELAESSEGVLLIDRAMAADELAELTALADLYASPHCSEGFGLTIAEAMAAGKPVVATDFAGSRDFVDSSVGWPVKAHPWRLDQDFGHYAQGGEWARIDEPALAAALIHAADAIEAGEDKGQAARRRIEELLSYEAVAEKVAASFAAVQTTPSESGGARIMSDLAMGMPVENAVFGPTLRVVALAADGALDAPLPEDLPTDPEHWVVLAPRGAVLSPLFERDWREAAAARPDAGIFYGDDVAIGEKRGLNQLRLKPCFDLTLLAAQDYIGAPLIVRSSVLADLGLRAEMGAALLDDLLLRAHHGGVSIARIAKVLLGHAGERSRADPAVRARMLAAQPLFAHARFRPGRAPGSLAQYRDFGRDHPAVTLLVPTRRSRLPGARTTYVERLLKAIATTSWPMERLTVIVGDDIAGEPAWAKRDWPFTLRRIETLRASDAPFNYAAKMNLLWRAAETEQIVMMNDDLLPAEPGWLSALIGFSIDETVGGVGARLLYPDGRLQHAGIAPTCGAIAHAWAMRPAGSATYQDWALVQREWSAVTGALFATRRSLMEEIGGFDERFTLEYNDIDLCLRLRALGYRIVCNPEAEMVHAEKASRGEMPAGGDQFAAFQLRWGGWLADDPAWHPGLRRDLFDLVPADDPGAWYR